LFAARPFSDALVPGVCLSVEKPVRLVKCAEAQPNMRHLPSTKYPASGGHSVRGIMNVFAMLCIGKMRTSCCCPGLSSRLSQQLCVRAFEVPTTFRVFSTRSSQRSHRSKPHRNTQPGHGSLDSRLRSRGSHRHAPLVPTMQRPEILASTTLSCIRAGGVQGYGFV